MKHHVFISVSYGVFNMPGFFDQFHDFIGYFQIEQSIIESHNKSFNIWFWTDKVEVKEGESRQVDCIIKTTEDGSLSFKLKKLI